MVGPFVPESVVPREPPALPAELQPLNERALRITRKVTRWCSKHLSVILVICGLFASFILFCQGRSWLSTADQWHDVIWSVYDGNDKWKRPDDLDTDRSRRDACYARGFGWCEIALSLVVGPLLIGIAKIIQIMEAPHVLLPESSRDRPV